MKKLTRRAIVYRDKIIAMGLVGSLLVIMLLVILAVEGGITFKDSDTKLVVCCLVVVLFLSVTMPVWLIRCNLVEYVNETEGVNEALSKGDVNETDNAGVLLVEKIVDWEGIFSILKGLAVMFDKYPSIRFRAEKFDEAVVIIELTEEYKHLLLQIILDADLGRLCSGLICYNQGSELLDEDMLICDEIDAMLFISALHHVERIIRSLVDEHEEFSFDASEYGVVIEQDDWQDGPVLAMSIAAFVRIQLDYYKKTREVCDE